VLSDTLCEAIAAVRYEQLPARTRVATATALLDATGVMLAASGTSEEVEPFLNLGSVSAPGACTILGTGQTASAPMAAFVNGALAHALDFEDAFDIAPCHPNAALVPATLATAQHFGGVDGPTFLAAMAIGCDVTCRMALSLRRPMEAGGWYPPPILGAFGATAAAARIAGLDAAQTRSALSLALCQATAPGEIKYSQSTTIRAVREAFPAQAAVQAVLLAKGGVIGFEQPFEGRAGFFALYAGGEYDPSDLLDGLGECFHIDDLTFKPWPACRGTHAYIEAALQLRQRPDFDWRAVDRVEVTVGRVQRMLVEPRDRKAAPETAIDAKFSIFFTAALALARGRVTLDDFDGASRGDPDVLTLTAKMVAIEDETVVTDAVGGRVVVRMRDGASLQADVPVPQGSPMRPMTRDALITKFIDCAGRARIGARLAPPALADALLDLENASDPSTLFKAF
jgi:2-methylcitrate dehydratase PrpD